MLVSNKRLIFVSNRLPLTVTEEGEQFRLKPSSGGLVTALRPILQASNGCWVGWTGTGYKPELRSFFASAEFEHCQLVPVLLTEEERRGFYCGFANEIVWPLFHDLQSRCNFDPAYWKAYLSVNRKFAQAVARVASDDSIIWVHDYHLMMLASMLRQLGLAGKLGFFQHIPFPPADIFEKLPWRSEILSALLEFDVVGFQTPRDQRNFVSCVRRLLPSVEMQRTPDRLLAQVGSRTASIGSFPISIDFEEFYGEASLPNVAQRAAEIRRDVNGCQVVLGVDRLDYTKGIPERLRAFQNLLATHPELEHRITLIQVVVPSREDIPKYQELKLDIERLVSRINGHYGSPGWVPVHYIYRHLERPELVALYRAADIALITPLKDGMNLVAKEFCAAQVAEAGVLVLSEFAGAAEELRNGAILVNPYDIERVAGALLEAFTMDAAERRSRMRRLRRKIRKDDVFQWCDCFCAHLESLAPSAPALADHDSIARSQVMVSTL